MVRVSASSCLRGGRWQYLLYKHALLHGLNASVAIDGGSLVSGDALVASTHFRTYWLLLNIAYVNEFFMQTLVKRGQVNRIPIPRLLSPEPRPQGTLLHAEDRTYESRAPRSYLSQQWMLSLQQILMLISTVFGLQVLQSVHVVPALLSLGLNLLRRGREVSNGLIVIAVAFGLRGTRFGGAVLA